MKKVRIDFIERKFNGFVSVEKVFRELGKGLDNEKYEVSFQQLPYLNTAFGMLKNLVFFRKRNGADIYHVTGECHYIALAMPSRRTVLTIHDLRFLHTRTGLRRWILKKILLDWPVRKLKYITAISEATKSEILQRSDCAPDKLLVVENPLDEFFMSDENPVFNASDPNILQIGMSPNKNLPNLIRALEGVNCRLTLIGEMDEETRHLLLEKNIRFENKSELAVETMKREYENADIVVFCSIYEGFGLPIIEAQAMRTPVVTSDISPLREVAGESGAVTVDPYDYKSIRDGILKVIADGDLRKILRENGLKNIQRFRRNIIAEKYEMLYDQITTRNSTPSE